MSTLDLGPSSFSDISHSAKPVLLVHGGAGTLFRGKISPEREERARQGLDQALAAGIAVLQAGGSSLNAVEAAVVVLEDCEVFNAGKGSVFSHEGHVEMDAAIMEGANRRAGSVAGVKGLRNPVQLARAVLEHSPHVLLIGPGAESFAREQGCTFEAPEYFYTDLRWQQLLQLREQQTTALDHALGDQNSSTSPDGKFGTVGAVALDLHGNLAVATSTGGMTNKRYGRVGDSPLIGAGTYADNLSCAVSGTGHGEYFIRSVLGHDLAARMRYGGKSLAEAAELALADLQALGGAGGLIAVDAAGNWAMPFTTDRMYRGWRKITDPGEIWIY